MNTKEIKKVVKGEKVMEESVKPLDMVALMQKEYGKNVIIIKDNLVFRCSTRVLEKGPKSLLELYLPNYGKMRKFIIKDDELIEIITDEIQKGTQVVKYVEGDKVENIEIDLSLFDINNCWNVKKAIKE